MTAPASPEAGRLTGEALDRIEAHAAAQGDMRAVHADVVALCREVRRLQALLAGERFYWLRDDMECSQESLEELAYFHDIEPGTVAHVAVAVAMPDVWIAVRSDPESDYSVIVEEFATEVEALAALAPVATGPGES